MGVEGEGGSRDGGKEGGEERREGVCLQDIGYGVCQITLDCFLSILRLGAGWIYWNFDRTEAITAKRDFLKAYG